jgi:hypothetical protein
MSLAASAVGSKHQWQVKHAGCALCHHTKSALPVWFAASCAAVCDAPVLQQRHHTRPSGLLTDQTHLKICTRLHCCACLTVHCVVAWLGHMHMVCVISHIIPGAASWRHAELCVTHRRAVVLPMPQTPPLLSLAGCTPATTAGVVCRCGG